MTQKIVVLLLLFAILISCSNSLLVALESKVLWDANRTYAKAELCEESNVRYRSLQDGNKGNEPAVSPAWWVQD